MCDIAALLERKRALSISGKKLKPSSFAKIEHDLWKIDQTLTRRGAATRSPLALSLRRALGTGVTDRIQHVLNCRCGLFGRVTKGVSWRAMRRTRCRACGSMPSCIQPPRF
jgi:hypothetical protein